ncbi:hypothetical protein BJ508DRAFT_411015 [Ascobolus immersus RN42]|uniref:Uncharacterized protein n=1 Tax=Ascobolus immersus RN42 TaxID=1160509 RepID=A0A3N4ILT4_ASCIM|nr:hypothetical protein BJ508DRAFT_411015 [Ascobolus immersus RN42]
MKLYFVALTAIMGLVSASPVAVEAPLEKRVDKYCKTISTKASTPCYINPQGNTPGTIRTNLPANYAFWADCKKSWQTPNGADWILVKGQDCFVSSIYVASNDGQSASCSVFLDVCEAW